jgi:hypothetical protein
MRQTLPGSRIVGVPVAISGAGPDFMASFHLSFEFFDQVVFSSQSDRDFIPSNIASSASTSICYFGEDMSAYTGTQWQSQRHSLRSKYEIDSTEVIIRDFILFSYPFTDNFSVCSS